MSSINTIEGINTTQKATLSSVVSDDSYTVGEAASTLLKSGTNVPAGVKDVPKAMSLEQRLHNPLLALANLVAGESLRPVPNEISNPKHQHLKSINRIDQKKRKGENKSRTRKMSLPINKKTKISLPKEIYKPRDQYLKYIPKTDHKTGNGENNKTKDDKKKVAFVPKNDHEDYPEDESDSQNAPRIIERTWHQNYNVLVQYHAIHGNSNVLRSDPNKQLSGWVKRQRNNLKDGKLSPNKIILLNELDFVWNRTDGAWYKKFCQLVLFEQKFAHSYVTARYDRSLAEWCQRQRREYKNEPQKMPSERVQKLEALRGWSWDKRKDTRKILQEKIYEVWKGEESE